MQILDVLAMRPPRPCCAMVCHSITQIVLEQEFTVQWQEIKKDSDHA